MRTEAATASANAATTSALIQNEMFRDARRMLSSRCVREVSVSVRLRVQVRVRVRISVSVSFMVRVWVNVRVSVSVTPT